MAKQIQEQFGQEIIDTVSRFATSDLTSVENLRDYDLMHVANSDRRQHIAEVWYGARWIYKLGLALLVQGVYQQAHVRAQIIDYASVCEGILRDAIDQQMLTGTMSGTVYEYKDLVRYRVKHKWRLGQHAKLLERQPLYWLIEVARDEAIIDASLAGRLHKLRMERNRVHVGATTYRAYLQKSRSAFDVVLDTVRETKKWCGV